MGDTAGRPIAWTRNGNLVMQFFHGQGDGDGTNFIEWTDHGGHVALHQQLPDDATPLVPATEGPDLYEYAIGENWRKSAERLERALGRTRLWLLASGWVIALLVVLVMVTVRV